ncbi:MAG: N-carbamoylputrescine amidase [Alphaproteobacteria bacterium]|nr:N-carbamoylputrescine amidase [Alphaproteobacteria bacterium]
MREITVAVTQMECGWDHSANHAQAEALVRRAAAEGADVVLLQELFETPYFCTDMNRDYFELARTFDDNPMIERMSALAAGLEVVLPVSFFERDGNAYFNTLAMIDADGAVLGRYRKSHIPEGPGYEEKFYFQPGDTGFRVWPTRFGILGAAICWDQWFPECARAMVLAGAEVLLYPSAIGNEPQDAALDSNGHWQRVMQGHAAANMVPVAASNRIGVEVHDSATMTFYGSSFVAGPTGEIVAEAPRDGAAVVTARFDLDSLAAARRSWGLFRDRRPDLYGALTAPPEPKKG